MAVEGLGELKQSFNKMFSKLIPEQQQMAVAKIALEGFTKVVMKTPVDTGRARANWSVTVNQAKTTAEEKFDPSPLGSGPAALAQAATTANSTTHGQTIFVTNALPYIDALENGHSKQGAHMVELSVNELKGHYGI